MHALIGVDRLDCASTHTLDLFLERIRQRQVHEHIVVGRREEGLPFFGETEAPRVVGGRAEELQFGTIAAEAIDALTKRQTLATYLAEKA